MAFYNNFILYEKQNLIVRFNKSVYLKIYEIIIRIWNYEKLFYIISKLIFFFFILIYFLIILFFNLETLTNSEIIF